GGAKQTKPHHQQHRGHDGKTGSAIHTLPLILGRPTCRIRYETANEPVEDYFQSSSASSSSSTYSSSSSSSNSSADSISRGSVPTTFKSAPHSSQLRESPSSTSSSSTSIWPSHTGQDTIASSPKYRYTKLRGYFQLHF